VGFLGGGVVLAGDWLMVNVLRVDDPVGAVPVHAFAGAWGTLAVALFAPLEALPAASRIVQLGVQGLGVLAVAAWGLMAGAAVFGLLRSTGHLRVPPEDEDRGLNEAEHGARTVWLDTLRTMRSITAERDLSRRAPEEPHTEAGEVARGVNELLGTLATTFSQWQADTERVAAAEEQLSGSAAAIAEHAQDSADRIARVGQSVSEANSVAQEVAERIQEVSRNASDANDRTRHGRQAVDQAVADIRALQSAGQRVEGANRTIEEIASKTDLLALNAAIEAANAGEAGQGFGVVAEEVRNLASQTAQATEEVGNLLQELQGRADQSVQAVEGLERTMAGMAQAVQETDQSADHIAQGAEKLAASMETAASDTHEVDASIHTVARYGKEVRSASEDLEELAQGLRRSLAVYRLPANVSA
jgi:Amt family ammonium transporter